MLALALLLCYIHLILCRLARLCVPGDVILGPAGMGAPAVGIEKLKDGFVLARAVETIKQLYNYSLYQDGNLGNKGRLTRMHA